MQAMMEVTADPPTIKYAGHLRPYYAEGDSFGLIVLVTGFACLCTGGMLVALMTNRRKTKHGAILHGILGALALAVVLIPLDYEEQVGTLDWGHALVSWAWPLAALWALLGCLGFLVGRIVKRTASS